MSEWEAFVACTCFKDGVATRPPIPRGLLTTNSYGIVTCARSEAPGEDPTVLQEWRQGNVESEPIVPPACRHENMRVVDEIFYWPGARSHPGRIPALEARVAEGGYPELLHALQSTGSQEFPSGGTWLTPEMAALALHDLDSLLSQRPRGFTEVDWDFVAVLSRLLNASVRTGNPIVTHYNPVWDDAWG